MRGPFVDGIAILVSLLHKNDFSFELRNLVSRGLEVRLNGQQDRVHLFQFMFQMGHGHFETHQAIGRVECGQSSGFQQ
jgi:hypothetical protein